MRYAFVAEHRQQFKVRAMCRCLRIRPSCSNRIARLASLAGIKAQIVYKRRPGSYGDKPSVVVDNTLARQFDVAAPDRAWVTDITYIRTQEGFAYLAVVIDVRRENDSLIVF